MRLALSALFTCAMVAQGLAANGPATAPATQPSAATLFSGQIEYTPPPAWKVVKTAASSDLEVVYLADDQDGFFRLAVLPENAAIDADAARKYAAQLRTSHKNANQEMVKTPEIEKDDRFAIKIHERYKNKQGKTSDETYLYREVNGRAMELQVQSLSEDPVHVGQVRKTAEDVLLSARAKATTPATQAVIGTLMNGRIEYNQPPPPWVRAKMANLSDDSAVAFGVEANGALLMLRILPPNAAITPAVAKDNVFALRNRHKKSNQEIVEGPTIEKDARFPIRIHERYREKDGKVVDETHLYLQVAGRAFELDVHTASDEAAQLEADRKVAEDVLISTHWKARTPAPKKPAKAG